MLDNKSEKKSIEGKQKDTLHNIVDTINTRENTDEGTNNEIKRFCQCCCCRCCSNFKIIELKMRKKGKIVGLDIFLPSSAGYSPPSASLLSLNLLFRVD